MKRPSRPLLQDGNAPGSTTAQTITTATGWHPLHRRTETSRPVVHFLLNGQNAKALAGDTILTAVLTQADHLRCNEFSGQHRAGFCLMGACQDCMVELGQGPSVRACSTLIAEGMVIRTNGRTNGQPQSCASHTSFPSREHA